MIRQDIRIRAATPEDAAAILEIYAPYVENTAVTSECRVPTETEFSDRIRRILKKYPYLVAEDNGEIVGYAYADIFRNRDAYAWAVETSVYVRSDMKRAGVGSALYNKLEQALRAQNILNLNACIAHPDEEDRYLTRASVVFHQRQGYRLVGQFNKCIYKFDKWYSVVWMEKHIGEHVSPQPPVRIFDEIKEDAGLL